MSQQAHDQQKYFEQNYAISLTNTQVGLVASVSQDVGEVVTRQHRALETLQDLLAGSREQQKQLQYCVLAAQLGAEAVEQLPSLRGAITLAGEILLK